MNPLPDLRDRGGSGYIVAFQPESHWIDGDFDPAALIVALKAQPALADFTDGLGNPQSAVRLDTGDASGLWVTVPARIDPAVIDAAVKAYAPPVTEVVPVVPSVAERVADALKEIAAQPPGTLVTSDQLVAVINALTS